MDNRLKLPPTKIDFDAVGTTGQDHDQYPAPGQARFDHMRMYLIALLSQQSSDSAPTEFREGTPWLDTGSDPPQLRVRLGGEWAPYGRAITLGSGLDAVSLLDWFDNAQYMLSSLAPDVTFSGRATGFAASITVPGPLRSSLKAVSRPLVYVNGLLLDPRETTLENDVVLLGVNRMKSGDRFSVLIRGIPNQNFYVPDAPAP